MSAELDMTQYLDLFLQEADEQLAILEQETLKLESEPTSERLQAIFRAAHTLKGSSRAMGYVNFASLTHEMENVLDRLRQGQIQPSTPVADVLLRCIDALAAMRNHIAGGLGDAASEVDQLVGELKAAGSDQPESVADAGNSAIGLDRTTAEALEAANALSPVFVARFTLRADCVMKFVRAFMAMNIVEEGGELLACSPAREALEEERFERGFTLYFQSEQPAELLSEKLGAISEVEALQLSNWPAKAAVPDKPPSPPSNPVAPSRATDAGQTVRVDVARLDELMSLVGELVIDRTRLAQIGADLAAKHGLDQGFEALAETIGHISRITGDLQDQIMKARMLPIETVFNRLPRTVRDLAQRVGKEIQLELRGGNTELDRSVIEIIGDPLLHILRNSIDHGIESPEDRVAAGKSRAGSIVVTARHEENHIVIEVADDGRGIDHERVKRKAVESGLLQSDAAARMTDKDALQFIFASGLSTAAEVSEVSGRGVGMDIVRANLQKVGGIADVETTLGVGTRFTIRLPLTLAIIRGLLVRVSDSVYVIPLGAVVETLLAPIRQIQTVKRREVLDIRGMTTPLVRLRDAFRTGEIEPKTTQEAEYVVVVGLADQRVGLIVDGLIGEQEVVIKSLNRFCGDVAGISGATILGDGSVALIVDVNGVLDLERR